MQEKIYEMLVNMQSNLEEMTDRLKRVEEMTVRLDKVDEMNDRLKRVEGTVNRIEASQTEDVVGLLKVTKKKIDFEVDYLNNKLTEMDKRLFILEKRTEN
ncbi:MAG: hypothetical protein LRY71_11350 [Bacillaceae bacterium]|nr:hypothetical protein [Bacillaceae bacterium]